MKTKFFSLIFGLFSIIVFSQEKLYNYTEEIQSSPDKVKKTETIVQEEFGVPTSPGIWTSNSADFGLMIRTKGNTFYIRAWQISNNSNIKNRVEKLMNKVKSIL